MAATASSAPAGAEEDQGVSNSPFSELMQNSCRSTIIATQALLQRHNSKLLKHVTTSKSHQVYIGRKALQICRELY